MIVTVAFEPLAFVINRFDTLDTGMSNGPTLNSVVALIGIAWLLVELSFTLIACVE